MIKHLSTIGRVTTPAAMIVFMAYEIHQSMTVTDWWFVAVLIGAFLSAVGVEIVGILSGYTLEGFWRLGNPKRVIFPAVMLVIYTAAAMYLLRNNDALLPLPVIAAVVYVVSALADSLVNQEQTEAEADHENRQHQHRQEEIAAARAHELKMKELELKHQERLAKANQPKVITKVTADRSPETFTDWRQIPAEIKRQMSAMSSGDIAATFGLAERTAQNWRKRAVEFSAEVSPSTNGVNHG